MDMEEHVKSEYTKYPRTPHLPWSEGATSDDVILASGDMFDGMNVVVTEKMDGENTTMYCDRIHARSISSQDHPSRHWVKTLWARMRADIPEGMRIVGENLYAKHSIEYDALPSFFLVFAIFDGQVCLSWEQIQEWCKLFGLEPVPVLFNGRWNKTEVKRCYTGKSRCGGLQEGYVVRNYDVFPSLQFQQNIAKFVRRGHVQTSEHWITQKIIPNRISA